MPSLQNDSGYVCYLNHARPPMDDQNIRLAVSYALDRRTYFEAFLSGQGSKNTSPWAKQPLGIQPDQRRPPSNTTWRRPRAILKPPVMSTARRTASSFQINIVYPAGYPEWKQGSEMFQAALAELGVDLKVEELELSTWIDRIVTTDEFEHARGTTTSSARSIRPGHFPSPSSTHRSKGISAATKTTKWRISFPRAAQSSIRRSGRSTTSSSRSDGTNSAGANRRRVRALSRGRLVRGRIRDRSALLPGFPNRLAEQIISVYRIVLLTATGGSKLLPVGVPPRSSGIIFRLGDSADHGQLHFGD